MSWIDDKSIEVMKFTLTEKPYFSELIVMLRVAYSFYSVLEGILTSRINCY